MKKCNYRESLEALLNRPAGELILVGAEGEDDKSAKDDADDTEDNDDDDDAGGDTDDDGDGEEDGDDDDPKSRRIKNLEEERDRHYTKRKAAEKKVTDLEAEITRLKKDGTTDEATKTQLSTLEAENKNLATRVGDMALENAFLKDNTHAWHNPDAALRLADLSKVEIDEDGTVHGLGDALAALADKNPFLLKTEEQKKPPAKKSGDRAGGQGGGDQSKTKSAKDAARNAELQSKYPGLRR